MTTRYEKIAKVAENVLQKNPNGINWSSLVKIVEEELPDEEHNTIWGYLGTFLKEDKVNKISRGIYTLHGASNKTEKAKSPKQSGLEKKYKEKDFYETFAKFLESGIADCTNAEALGGNLFRKKWSTPDVIGTYKSIPGDVIQFQTEIVSAEIKTNESQPIEAFGQAISYRLFSTKVYLVLPNTVIEEDKERVLALCNLFGIGLVYFSLDPDNPDFYIVLRAQRFEPDKYWVNEIADRLKRHKLAVFRSLF